METKALIRKVFERTHVLADGDAIAQQDRVGGPRAIGYVVDVVGIDPNESRAAICQELSCLPCEKGMTFKVLICAPVTGPVCMDEYSFALQI